jgi:hypothetical protein
MPDNSEPNNKKLTPVDAGYTYNVDGDKLSIDRIQTSETGRYSKCTPDRIDAIEQDIILGLSNKDAALANDIDPATIGYWMKRGRIQAERYNADPDYIPPSGERMFLYFYKRINSAVAKRKKLYLSRIAAAGEDPKHWTANAWMLERMHTQEFGRQIKIEVNDWKRDAIELIRQGLQFEVASETFGEAVAIELFEAAGEKVPDVIEGKFKESGDD